MNYLRAPRSTSSRKLPEFEKPQREKSCSSRGLWLSPNSPLSPSPPRMSSRAQPHPTQYPPTYPGAPPPRPPKDQRTPTEVSDASCERESSGAPARKLTKSVVRRQQLLRPHFEGTANAEEECVGVQEEGEAVLRRAEEGEEGEC